MKFTTCFRRAGAALAALAAAILLPSCFEAHSTVKVKKDGSGTIENKTIMSAQMAGMMNAAAAQEGGDAKNPLLDEEQLKEQASKMGEGVEFVGVKELKFEDGRMGSVATYKFSDVTKIKMEPGQAGPPGDEAPEEEGAEADGGSTFAFGFKAGDKPTLTVKMPPPAKAEEEKAEEGADAEEGEEGEEGEPKAAEGAEGADEAAMAMMAPMLQGMRIGMNVEVEGSITETTATNREGNTVTLMDIDFGKLMTNPEFAKKMKSPDDLKDFAQFSELAKKAGATVEPKPEISITFE